MDAFIIFFVMYLMAIPASGIAISEFEFNEVQGKLKDLPLGDRIAYWAELFIGTPYDPDPLGEYVRKRAVVADERVDCMYTTFRAIELSMSNQYADTVSKALDVRFKTHGKIDENGQILNYDERYEYGIDMVSSGKFGKDVSGKISRTVDIKGERGITSVSIVEAEAAIDSLKNIRNGDIIFFIKDPGKRVAAEIVGHIGIASVNEQGIFLIHASGVKNGNGIVKKVELKEYLQNMPFAGIMVTRFD